MTPGDANLPCTSTQDAIARLRFVLDLQGGTMEEDDEPGLSDDQRITENALRQVIKFLEAMPQI